MKSSFVVRSALMIAFLLTGSFAFVAAAAQAAQADIDPTFGGDGKVTTDFGGNDAGEAMVLQPDGRIVVVGTSGADFALARYNANGSLDTTFGSGGKVTTNFGGNDAGKAVALQPDGKIVVAGNSDIGGGADFALARYNANGSLDTTFGSGGKIFTDFGAQNDYGEAVAIQTDGRIVVAGYGVVPFGVGGFGNAFALARYNTNGSLDTAFDDDGKVTTTIGSQNDLGQAVTIQPDGRIVVAGSSSIGSGAFALARYNTDGSLDTTFDTDGKVTTDIGSESDAGNAVTIQPDGRIVVAGRSSVGSCCDSDFALARYSANGSLDTTFDTDGKVTTNFGTGGEAGEAVATQPDGRIVVAGRRLSVSDDFALARYNTNGSLDSTFGSGGKVTTDMGGPDYGKAVVIQPDGRIVVAGSSHLDHSNGHNDDFAVVRYQGTGPPIPISSAQPPGPSERYTTGYTESADHPQAPTNPSNQSKSSSASSFPGAQSSKQTKLSPSMRAKSTESGEVTEQPAEAGDNSASAQFPLTAVIVSIIGVSMVVLVRRLIAWRQRFTGPGAR